MATEKPLDSLRREYTGDAFGPENSLPDPFDQFAAWYRQAEEAEDTEANAMCLGTVSADGTPGTRIVLLKEFDSSGFVFFTNYESEKARAIESTGKASLLFFWPVLARQVRIVGSVEKVDRETSEAYFSRRPRGSQIGAWASRQSSALDSRSELEAAYQQIADRFDNETIPCPTGWGGYRVAPENFEFWQGRQNRLHDRVKYSREGQQWVRVRLSP